MPIALEADQSPLRVCLKFLQEGHDPAAALEFVAEWGHGEFKPAFQAYARQLQQGRSLPEILEDIADTYPSPETELILASLQARIRTGVFPPSAPQIIDEAAAMEHQIREDMEFLVGPARRWTLGLVWVGILLGAVLLIAIPQYSNALLGSPVGRAVFCAAVALQTIGFMWAAALFRLQSEIECELKRR